MWSVALRVGGCGRGGGWFVVLRWLFCGVVRGGAIHDARCRNGTCGRSRCVSTDAGGAMVECCFASVGLWSFRRPVCGIASVIRASRVAPLRLRVVECCFAAVIRASQVAPLRLRRLNVVSRRLSGRHGWRPYVCGWLNVVSRVVVGGVTGGCRRKGMGMKKRSRTDVAVSVWLLVVAEARLERTTSRL